MSVAISLSASAFRGASKAAGHGAIARVSRRPGERLPELLGHVREQRVERAQGPLEDEEQDLLGTPSGGLAAAPEESVLRRLHVPVRDVVPDEGAAGRSGRRG